MHPASGVVLRFCFCYGVLILLEHITEKLLSIWGDPSGIRRAGVVAWGVNLGRLPTVLISPPFSEQDKHKLRKELPICLFTTSSKNPVQVWGGAGSRRQTIRGKVEYQGETIVGYASVGGPTATRLTAAHLAAGIERNRDIELTLDGARLIVDSACFPDVDQRFWSDCGAISLGAETAAATYPEFTAEKVVVTIPSYGELMYTAVKRRTIQGRVVIQEAAAAVHLSAFRRTVICHELFVVRGCSGAFSVKGDSGSPVLDCNDRLRGMISFSAGSVTAVSLFSSVS